jgi:hypothetical protein
MDHSMVLRKKQAPRARRHGRLSSPFADDGSASQMLDELPGVICGPTSQPLQPAILDTASDGPKQIVVPEVKISRCWAMPSRETFSIKPIAELLARHIQGSDDVVDPFARNATLGNWTNDINPNTAAKFHLHAEKFCKMLAQKGVTADVVLFDPPYSARQAKECYEGIGHRLSQHESQVLFARVKDSLNELLRIGGLAISFGWNSTGLGKKRGYELLEVLLVCHGRCHNDTIVVVERKIDAE